MHLLKRECLRERTNIIRNEVKPMRSVLALMLAITPVALTAFQPEVVSAAALQYQVSSCARDISTASDIGKNRLDKELVELALLDGSGTYVGSLFASWSHSGELYAHHVRLCGKGENYFYVKADDLRDWVGEESEFKTVSAIQTESILDTDLIHHDEASALVAVETLSVSDASAEVRIIFQAWNYATEASTSGIFTTTIPLKKPTLGLNP